MSAPAPRLPPPPGQGLKRPPPAPPASPAAPAGEGRPLPVADHPAATVVDAAPVPSWVNELPDAETIVPQRRRWGLLVAGGAAVAVVLLVVSLGRSKPPATPAVAAPAPVDFEGARARALAFFQAGKFAEAAAAYQVATRLAPTHAGAFAGLGGARARAGDVAGAIAAYQQAVRLAPEHSGFHAALGRAHRQAGARQAALAEYRRALQLDPRNEAAQKAVKELAPPR